MKRINQKTGTIFHRGDVREDGFIFQGYASRKLKDGTFSEVWMRPKIFKNNDKANSLRGTARLATASGRAVALLNAAKRRSICLLTKEWLLPKLEKGVCELTGLPFDLSSPEQFTQNPYAPSLDRINASVKEYTPENTRVVLVGVNQTLNQHGEKTMLPILKAMVSAIEAAQ